MSKQQTILVVDDQSMNLELMKDLLEPLGHRLVLVNSGEEALEKMREGPDLVLLDVRMPGMDGFQVCQRIKGDEKTQVIPVVMVTALTASEDRLQALEAGADDFLSKPVDTAELLARVKSLLRVKAYHDQVVDYSATLERRVEERTAALRAAQLETIYRLSVTAEYRDEDTYQHILRMSHYSAAIARQMQLPDQEVERLHHASPMHDIGKVGISDTILLKPGKLTPEEFEKIKEHTLIGARILANSSSDLLQMGEIIALTHHEKFNGQGYPNGLAGEEIPLVGRIVAVADVFDALTTDRVYKKAFPVDQALTILREDTGTHFDPQVMEAFLAITEEVLDIKDRFKEEAGFTQAD